VEVVHRIRTDPGRLSRRFYDEAMASGLSDAQYVEIAGLVAQLTGVDSFCRAIGVPLHPLPEPVPGSPTRRRPAGAKPGAAWVPWVEPADAVGTEADLYPRVPRIPNVAKALSLVPAEVHGMADLSAAHYMQMQQVIDVRVHRTLSRAQMELIAGRVSALNQCFY
jgi:alkylhydroperoxidase family enzyme